ncbi:expressed protein [Echinococcus multilocularis]|uniref:Expressed protein n=1 Tax=Echinococcus multilocularis TaxID=6211 RepID=A0A068Y298_ECHMU|nr:expressed protein [Echinococcus multilocularis]
MKDAAVAAIPCESANSPLSKFYAGIVYAKSQQKSSKGIEFNARLCNIYTTQTEGSSINTGNTGQKTY